MLNGKAVIIILVVGLMTKRQSIRAWIFSKTNYATKTDLKNKAGVDTSKFFKKVNLAHLKSDVDKMDIDKLKTYQVI